MSTDHDDANSEGEIRAIIERRVTSVGNKDIDGLMARQAPEVLSFDVVDPLQHVGAESIRNRLSDWFASYKGSIGYEIRELGIVAGERIAFCHYLFRITGTLNAGGEVAMWVRATVCLERTDNTWLIVHEHQSVPFDAETGQASLELNP